MSESCKTLIKRNNREIETNQRIVRPEGANQRTKAQLARLQAVEST